MRLQFINYAKRHRWVLNLSYSLGHILLVFYSLFLKKDQNKIIFSSFGGRNYDDSVKAIYEEMLTRQEFKDWEFVWAFVHPERFAIPIGKKVKIDTLEFFKCLLTSKIWVSNSGMDRNLCLKRDNIISVETWHGTPIKRICGEEEGGSITRKIRGKIDTSTIRCAQSNFDRDILSRVMHASKSSFLLSDLPRNDSLVNGNSQTNIEKIRKKLDIKNGKKVLLYMPTYREYLVDKKNSCYIAPPIELSKWREQLGENYIFLFRAHYAIGKSMNLKESEFIRDVSSYAPLNELYLIADILISDYSSAFIDFSILERPMMCFAYDQEEYEKKRGLYVKLQEMLPCPIDREEDALIQRIKEMDVKEYCDKTVEFHNRYAPNAGQASRTVVNEIVNRL